MQFLRLDRVVTDFEEGASVTLPQLSHLHITDLTTPIPARNPIFTHTYPITNVFLCPALTHLACIETASPRPVRDYHRHLLILPSPSSSLRSVTFSRDSYPLLHHLVRAAPRLVALRELAFGRAQPESMFVAGVRQLLCRVPHSLDVLDASTVDAPNSPVRALRKSFERGDRGVSGLRVLRLARGEAQPDCELSWLVEHAEARGVKVEWV